jgi:hypothetical protein
MYIVLLLVVMVAPPLLRTSASLQGMEASSFLRLGRGASVLF